MAKLLGPRAQATDDAVGVGYDALNALDEATAEMRAVRDRLATLLFQLELEKHWLVPRSHRPTCPLDGKPCSSWTCLVDVCVDEKKEN